MNTITNKLVKYLEKIRDSLLTSWQKLDGIRTFIQPCITYALRTCPVSCESLKIYRSKLIGVLRSICNLPKRATTHYFFAARMVGDLGLQDPFDERHVQPLCMRLRFYQLLIPSSKISPMANLVVYRCFHCQPSNDEVDAFLSGSLDGELSNHSASNNSQML